MKAPSRGEIWVVNLNPTKGHEQAGKRPAFVISVDAFNRGPAELVVVLPITSKYKGIPFHVEVEPPGGNLDKNSYIKCEDIRSISKLRLEKFVGETSKETIREVEDRLRILLNL
ncbi:type II toxin-antitoxin system PemK/MazF family toxin [candidate division WOR-3 bacterium]|nr:type II toxin-antitoxin system PemK/MazF family toxin [candidate division WOR-3 bacterium]MCK4528632.1 type II toxin-antitoxin system PemK/MazF family toxin [candidate division WOR-3 bacterium]